MKVEGDMKSFVKSMYSNAVLSAQYHLSYDLNSVDIKEIKKQKNTLKKDVYKYLDKALPQEQLARLHADIKESAKGMYDFYDKYSLRVLNSAVHKLSVALNMNKSTEAKDLDLQSTPKQLESKQIEKKKRVSSMMKKILDKSVVSKMNKTIGR